MIKTDDNPGNFHNLYFCARFPYLPSAYTSFQFLAMPAFCRVR